MYFVTIANLFLLMQIRNQSQLVSTSRSQLSRQRFCNLSDTCSCILRYFALVSHLQRLSSIFFQQVLQLQWTSSLFEKWQPDVQSVYLRCSALERCDLWKINYLCSFVVVLQNAVLLKTKSTYIRDVSARACVNSFYQGNMGPTV